MGVVAPPSPNPNQLASSLQSDIETKEEMKYNPELERMAKDWIGRVLREDLSSGPISSHLKSGVLLCRLVNAVKPKSVAKVRGGDV